MLDLSSWLVGSTLLPEPSSSSLCHTLRPPPPIVLFQMTADPSTHFQSVLEFVKFCISSWPFNSLSSSQNTNEEMLLHIWPGRTLSIAPAYYLNCVIVWVLAHSGYSVSTQSSLSSSERKARSEGRGSVQTKIAKYVRKK